MPQCPMITEVFKSRSMKPFNIVVVLQNYLGYLKDSEFEDSLNNFYKTSYLESFQLLILEIFFPVTFSPLLWERVPQAFELLFIFFKKFFKTCSSEWIISIALSSSSRILSSAILNLLLKSSSDVFHFQNHTLQFHDFYVALFGKFYILY